MWVTLYKEEAPFLPVSAVMSELQWCSPEEKSCSPKAEEEDEKDVGSCWLPSLCKSA